MAKFKAPEGAKITRNAQYSAIAREAKQKGIQPSERIAITKIKAKRGVTTKEARAIIARRTAAGKSVAGQKKGIATWEVTKDDGTKVTRSRQVGPAGGYKGVKKRPKPTE